MKKENNLYLLGTILLFLISIIRIIVKAHEFSLADFAAYSAVSRAFFEGLNPFPTHFELLFCKYGWGNVVPIVYPGQMLFFVIPGYIWGKAIQIGWIVLNILVIYFLTALTILKTQEGYEWRDLFIPGKKQFLYALCCFVFLSSNSVKETLLVGQIPIILALCLYCMSWVVHSNYVRAFLFAFIALCKYSLLPIIAFLLFFKGHWKLCFVSFAIFCFFSITPAFFGNSLLDVYSQYINAVELTFQPGGINHFYPHPDICHLSFFKNPLINCTLKSIAILFTLYLFWKERKNTYLSDTLMLLALSLTMVISYHRYYDMVLLFPLFFIRLFAFVQKKNGFSLESLLYSRYF